MSEGSATPELPVPKRSRWFWLRVSVSVFFGVLTVALCVLWVRSYWRAEMLDLKLTNRRFSAFAAVGVLGFARFSAGNNIPDWGILYGEDEITDSIREQLSGTTRLGFGLHRSPDVVGLAMPFVLPVALSAAASFVSWKGWVLRRFSLRTLLFATTLVAVVLGLVVWMVR